MGERKVVVKSWVTPGEKTRIAAHSRQCGMSMSGYTRTLTLGGAPRLRVDVSGLAEVFRLQGDLGRLGGLLKMLLTNDERLDDIGREMGRATIDAVLLDIRVTMDRLKLAVEDFLSVRHGRLTAPTRDADEGEAMPGPAPESGL